jgi:phosphoribosylformylglycinamidine synthase
LIWHSETDLRDIDVLVLPGGFSYGDYLRCGAIARFTPIMQAVKAYAERGGYVLGICNGFQILVEAGLLPGALMRNRNLQFICDRVLLQVERADLAWTQHYQLGQEITFPIAHGEGCYTCDADTLAELQDHNQIVFRYMGEAANGSLDRIAGICNRTGTILGLMPHPERAADAELNRLSRTSNTDGLPLWQSVIAAVSAKLVLQRT